MSLCVYYWVYERNFCIVIKTRVSAVEWHVFLCHFEQHRTNKGTVKIVGRNRIFLAQRLIKAVHNKRKCNHKCIMETNSSQLDLQDFTNHY